MGPPLPLYLPGKSNNSLQMPIRGADLLDTWNRFGQDISGVLTATTQKVYWRCREDLEVESVGHDRDTSACLCWLDDTLALQLPSFTWKVGACA